MVQVDATAAKIIRTFKGIAIFIVAAIVFGIAAYHIPVTLSRLLGIIFVIVCIYNIYKPSRHEETPRHIYSYLALLIASPFLFMCTPEPEAVQEQAAAPSSPLSNELMPKGNEFLYYETDAKRVAWIINGKSSIKQRLKDPDSAKFRGMFFANNIAPVACGEVNSKNSFGGYTGYKRFVTANRIDLTFIETDLDAGEFDKVWQELCRR